MQAAVIGAILFEGWAADMPRRAAMADSGDTACQPPQHHPAGGPMAGVISPSMPVWIVENAAGSNRAFSNMNEGLGKALRFGANSPEVIKRLHWMADVLAPAIGAALAKLGPLELKPLIAQALQMGDEVHNRNAAASSLLLKRIVPAALVSGFDQAGMAEAVTFIAGNDHFFLFPWRPEGHAGCGARCAEGQPGHGHVA